MTISNTFPRGFQCAHAPAHDLRLALSIPCSKKGDFVCRSQQTNHKAPNPSPESPSTTKAACVTFIECMISTQCRTTDTKSCFYLGYTRK